MNIFCIICLLLYHLSTLLQEDFLRVLRFSPLPQNQHFILFDLIVVDLI